jgi:hypothetical protein
VIGGLAVWEGIWVSVGLTRVGLTVVLGTGMVTVRVRVGDCLPVHAARSRQVKLMRILNLHWCLSDITNYPRLIPILNRDLRVFHKLTYEFEKFPQGRKWIARYRTR